ncbi:MAG TPA: glycosyltransferase family 2 protein [Chthonomonadaceae bacterium]|nr:glycosyltransferase family 2 protein [Chthonomonadaceae bacterium]
MHGILPTNGLEWLFTLTLLPPLAFFAGCVALNLRFVVSALRTEASDKGGREARRSHGEENPCPGYRFLILIPAHNEELLLADTLRSLTALNYPSAAYEVLVIADNCTDRTASIAREHGVCVYERQDLTRVGKGYALNDAIQALLSLSPPSADPLSGNPLCLCVPSIATGENPDALVFLDADTLVEPNLLQVFAEGLRRGESVQQTRYEVRNPNASWRTRLLACALALIHIAKPLGRERLHLSDSLKGNGMCLTPEILIGTPWRGDALAEDLDYTLRLVRQGVRVAFRPDAVVYGEMAANARSAATQRRRWEAGRWQLLRQTPALLLEGIRTRNRLLIDRALDLLIPPFAERFALLLALAALACFIAQRAPGLSMALLAGGFFTIIGLEVATLAMALRIARVPRRAVLSLLFAPVYLIWKLTLLIGLALRRTPLRWQRTERT